MTGYLLFLFILLAVLFGLYFLDLVMADFLTMISMIVSADRDGSDYMLFSVRDLWRMRREIHTKEVNSK